MINSNPFENDPIMYIRRHTHNEDSSEVKYKRNTNLQPKKKKRKKH